VDNTVSAFGYLAMMHGKSGDLERAAAGFENAASALEQLRASLGSDESKVRFGQQFFEIFPDGVGVFAALGDSTNAPKWYERAYEFAEMGIGRVFLEMLGRSRAKVRGGLPVDVIAEGEKLDAGVQAALDAVDAEIRLPAEQQSQDRRRIAYEQLHAARDALENYRARLLSQFPAYASLMNPRPAPLNEIREKVIGEDEAALEYILGDQASWLLVITRTEARVFPLPPKENIENMITVYREKLTRPSESVDRLKRSGDNLYQTLIAPAAEILAEYKNLIIVPTGGLYFLPFEALTNGDRFLISDYNIRYAPSLNVMYMAATVDAEQAGGGWIGFGDPVYAADDPRVGGASAQADAARGLTRAYLDAGQDASGAFKRIPGTGDEVRAVAGIFGDRASVHIGLDASEAAFKSNVASGGYEIIHVASHGTLGAGQGLEPALILSTFGDMRGEDGFMQMSEVFNLRTPARLVTLSACETGRGRLQSGEGVAGMSRAFLYAGAHSLIVSLWSVADAETRDLMIDFYKRIQAGDSAQSALTNARRAMAEAGMHPYFWAPFIIMGSGE
jgi:CHAT domain-containing protein